MGYLKLREKKTILDCKFCEMGEYKRQLAYRLVEDLSKGDLRFLLKIKANILTKRKMIEGRKCHKHR